METKHINSKAVLWQDRAHHWAASRGLGFVLCWPPPPTWLGDYSMMQSWCCWHAGESLEKSCLISTLDPYERDTCLWVILLIFLPLVVSDSLSGSSNARSPQWKHFFFSFLVFVNLPKLTYRKGFEVLRYNWLQKSQWYAGIILKYMWPWKRF